MIGILGTSGLLLLSAASAAPKAQFATPTVGKHTLPVFEDIALAPVTASSRCNDAVAEGFNGGITKAAEQLRGADLIPLDYDPARATSGREVRKAKKALNYSQIQLAPEASALARRLDVDYVAYGLSDDYKSTIGDSTYHNRWVDWFVVDQAGNQVARLRGTGMGSSAEDACRAVGVNLAWRLSPALEDQTYKLARDKRIKDQYGAFAEGDLDAVRVALKELEAADPTDSLVQYNLGVIADATGNVEAARRYYARASGFDERLLRAAEERLDALAELEAYGYVAGSTAIGGAREMDLSEGQDPAEVTVLRVDSQPPGARVFIGADDFGRAPVEVRGLEPGGVQVTLVLEHHLPGTATVQLEAGQVVESTVALEKETGTLALTALPGSTVTLHSGEEVTVGEEGVVELSVAVGMQPFQVRLADHVEVHDSVIVEVGRTYRVTVDQGLEPATLHLSGWPAGTIHLDGVEVGFEAVELELPPGEHEVRVSAPDHATFVEELELAPGQSESLRYQLQPLRGVFSLRVDGDLPASLRVNDHGYDLEAGEAWSEELRAGEHTFVVVHPDYLPWERTIHVSDEGGEVVAELEPRPGRVLVVSSPIGAHVFVDGVSKGVTPAQLELPAGEASITLKMEGYQEGQRFLEVLPNQDHRLSVQLRGEE